MNKKEKKALQKQILFDQAIQEAGFIPRENALLDDEEELYDDDLLLDDLLDKQERITKIAIAHFLFLGVWFGIGVHRAIGTRDQVRSEIADIIFDVRWLIKYLFMANIFFPLILFLNIGMYLSTFFSPRHKLMTICIITFMGVVGFILTLTLIGLLFFAYGKIF